ncbi:L-piperidine-6-carboxylate dehydrogenase [Flexibacterium corallicola]|uniref:L-piperidine-6-carboxylate dehydrogenase n=1 Tax=Flexibacterium corallicola TaxID=3037259 RepID=UPI00286F6A65|nr:aldehyde dehydrogenase family protein [Pseudovibrio sp. M1P-2-3]
MATTLDISRLSAETVELMGRMGVATDALSGGSLQATSPLTGEKLAMVRENTVEETKAAIDRAHNAFKAWRALPAPRRGELVRLLGEELRTHKDDLGLLVSVEAGKITSEGLGEVQEMIDICDFAVGLSRQLYGLTIATERPGHKMMETWHPAGVVGVISAFNFPVAVWSWNAALAFICGDSVVWKPSEKTPLTALAVEALFKKALAKFGADAPEGLLEVIQGDRTIGETLVDDKRVPVISATGSTRMGRQVGPRVAERFGRSILELGGNNAAIIAPSADLDLTLRGVAFSAMGTAGQRCTTLRRLIVHESVYEAFLPRLVSAYGSVTIGYSTEESTLVGPLIDKDAFDGMQKSLEAAKAAGGKVHGGERVHVGGHEDAYYVKPAIVEMPEQAGPMLEETFAPILYVVRYSDLDQAIDIQNSVGAGLSSSIFTTNLMEAEKFTSVLGSDCGIANVNIGPSGAEIGGAFGGEKETGGGREAGSDSWKAYMRRATNTINYSGELPLAQGVKFDVD